jgi:hypothetical protein
MSWQTAATGVPRCKASTPRCKASTPRWSARSRSGPCLAPSPPPALRYGTRPVPRVPHGRSPGPSPSVADVGHSHRCPRAGRGGAARLQGSVIKRCAQARLRRRTGAPRGMAGRARVRIGLTSWRTVPRLCSSCLPRSGALDSDAPQPLCDASRVHSPHTPRSWRPLGATRGHQRGHA